MKRRYKQKTFKGWMSKNFNKDELHDLANHGAVCGFSGLIYYTQTNALYQKFHDEIWEMVREDAEGQGLDPLKLISEFGGAKNVVDKATFDNLLVWYAAEKIAYESTYLNRRQ